MGRPRKNADNQSKGNESIELIQGNTNTETLEVVESKEVVNPLVITAKNVLNPNKVGLKNISTGKMIAMAIDKNLAEKMVAKNNKLEIIS